MNSNLKLPQAGLGYLYQLSAILLNRPDTAVALYSSFVCGGIQSYS